MPASTKRKPTETAAPSIATLQRFEIREILRSQITPSAYNPRRISDYQKSLLRKSLETFGLVEPLIWNATTGVLCGGHQRLDILDAEQGYPGKASDYKLTVSAVSLSPKREKELNVFLNNRAAQGDFDKDSFFALLKDPEIDLAELGFTKPDLEFEFGELPDLMAGVPPPVTSSQAEDAAADPIKHDPPALKAAKEKGREKAANAPSEDADHFLRVAFGSRTEKESFLRSRSLDPLAAFVNAGEVFEMKASA